MGDGLEQEQWYYQRCEATTGRRFDHRWIEKRGQSTWLPNAVIYASEMPLSLTHSPLINGQPS